MDSRAALEAEDLLRIVLLLVAIWLALEILGEVLHVLGWLLGPLQPVLGLLILSLIALWFLDRI